MRVFLLLPFLLLLFHSRQAQAQPQTNLYVDSSMAISGAGTSWTTAYKTLNEALNVANNGSTTVSYNVHIAKGTYYPTGLQSGTNRAGSFAVLRNGLRLYGGYSTGGGTRNATVNTTTLSGDIGVLGDSSDNSFTVMLVNNISNVGDSVIIDGFVVRGGNGGNGGGLWVDSAYGNTVLSNCSIRNNNANLGGGIYMSFASITFQNNSLERNKASIDGGAIYIYNSIGQHIYSSTFTQNEASGTGGAVYHGGANPGFWDCVFTGNSAAGMGTGLGGGAIYSEDGPIIRNCTFTQNTASRGGGIRSRGFSTFLLINNSVFSQNTAFVGGGIYMSSIGESCKIDSSTFIGNRATNGDGGAIYRAYVFSGFDTLTCKNTLFNNNTAFLGKGGAVADRVGMGSYIHSKYINCTFSNDSARYGGALFLNTQIKLNNCSFISNYASNKGGACYDSASNSYIYMCRFQGNRADTTGGALFMESPQTRQITSTLFSGNWGGQQGGAMALFNTNNPSGSSSSIWMENITLAGDSAANGNGLYCSNSTLGIRNSILWEGALNTLFTVSGSFPTITNSTVEGGFTGTGNTSTNPNFIAPQLATAAPTTAGDYMLPNCSPAVDAAGSSAWFVGPTDVAGNPRFAGSAYDMGAYEFQPSTVAGIITSGLRDTLCIGTPMQLTSSVSGGTWTHSNPAVATLSASGLVTGILQGSDTISYTVVSSGCSATVKKVIWVFPSPTRPGPVWGPSALCVGQSAIYTISWGGAIWSTSDTNIAIITYPTTPTYNNRGDIFAKIPGTVKVFATVTNTYGCSVRDSLPVTVSAYPAVPNITGGNKVCENSTLQLSSNTPGGVWSVTGRSSFGLTVNNTGLVSATQVDSGYITYTVTNQAGCATTDSHRVVVNPAPQPTTWPTGPGNVCVNSSATYTIALSGGTWSTLYNNGSITSAGVYTATQAGYEQILYNITDPVTGCVGSAGLNIANLGPDYKSVSAAFCGPANANYNFGGRILTAAGVYKDTFQNRYGCDSIVTLTYTDRGPNVVLTQSGRTLTAAYDPNAIYSWFECTASGGKNFLGWSNRIFSSQYNGRYGVRITNTFCTLESDCYQIGPTDVSNISTESWNLYPNPTSGSATLQTGSVIAKNIVVRDITGKLLLEMKPTSVETTLDLKGFASGLYLVAVQYNEGNTTTLRLTVTGR